jgi:glycine dehydrogenase subunit 1
MAVASAAYMAVLGANGLRRVAVDCMRKAKDLAAGINAIPGFEAPIFKGAHFNEFTVRYQGGYEPVHQALLAKGVHGGMQHARHLRELRDFALFAVTERHTKHDMDRLLEALRSIR